MMLDWEVLILYWALDDNPKQWTEDQLKFEMWWCVQECLRLEGEGDD